MKPFGLKSATLSLAALAVSATTALAADVTMNVGFGAPEESLYGRFGVIFERLAEEYTGGSVDVKLRCCNQIATEDEAFKAMQLGTVDGFFITANNVSPHWPLMDVTVLPYIFQDANHLARVLDGPVGQMMKDKLQADTSVHLLAFGPALYRDFYNSVRPVNTMADMAGLSATQFNVRFRSVLRMSPTEYVLSRRVQDAQRRLTESSETIADIGINVGFVDQSHFTKRFRKITGMTPLAYRKRFRQLA